jgi:perosamine synthetase
VAIPQVNRLKEITAARNANAAGLTAGLAGTPGLLLPTVPAGRGHVWHQYTVRIASQALISREEFRDRLTRSGVGHGIYYPKLMHDYPCYLSHPQVVVDDTPSARRMTAEVVSLPVHTGLDKTALAKIVNTAKEAIGG